MRATLKAIAFIAAAAVTTALLGSTVPGVRFIGIPAAIAFMALVVWLASRFAGAFVEAGQA